MDNKDDVLTALEEFERTSTPSDTVPDILHRYLLRIAKTGETTHPWDKLKPLFLHKLNLAMNDFHEKVPTDHLLPSPNVENVKFDEMRNRILDMAATFSGAPFTIQRLCELITNPLHHYKRTDKFLRGIEKNVLIVSTVDPFGNKIVNESKFLFNGLDSNGVEAGELRTPEKISSPFMPPPPTNSPVISLFEAAAAADSPSSLLHSWPPGGSSDASSALSASNETVSSNLGPSLEHPNWEAGFDDYLPPEKKPRLSSTPPSLEANGKSSLESGTESTPSVSELFRLQGQSTSSDQREASQSSCLGTDCEFGSGSVSDGRISPPVSTSPEPSVSQEVVMSSSSMTVSSSESLQLSSGSQFLRSTDSTLSSTDSVVSSQTLTDADNETKSDSTTDDSPKQDAPDSMQDLSDNAVGEPCEMEEASSACEVHPDIPSQEVEDGTDRRDSQGFDVSPNPEGSDSPTSEQDGGPCLDHTPSESIPDPEVSSSSETVPSESGDSNELENSQDDTNSTSTSNIASSSSSSESEPRPTVSSADDGTSTVSSASMEGVEEGKVDAVSSVVSSIDEAEPSDQPVDMHYI